jgi:hypothetical protein
MNDHRMFELAHNLAVAKNRQDVPAALRLLHPEMLLESPAFGTRARGPATFNDDLIASERFFFDLSELCAQSGVSTDAVRQKLSGAGS